MNKETIGTVLSVAKQWWLKVNTKPVRMGALDGARQGLWNAVGETQYQMQERQSVMFNWLLTDCRKKHQSRRFRQR